MLERQPAQWANTASAQRLEEVVRFEHASLYPKFHLSHNVDLIGSFHALEPLDLKWFTEFVDSKYDSALAIDYRFRPETVPLGA